jgi:O-antigen chain-terminating methyltransferase
MVQINETTTSAREGGNHLLTKLVADLPEIYQPIFGHPELSTGVRRECEDRLTPIVAIFDTLTAKLKRPLRILDLGCAQGFFSLSLAKRGATVLGLDFLEANIALCQALAAEHLDCAAHFRTGLVEDVCFQLEAGQYDLVLGLSVFHHIVHRLGCEFTQKLLDQLATKAIAGIFELALNSEPLYWAASQPENPKHLLSGYAFIHEFSRNKSHLSTTNRPLYIASNRYWFLNGHAEAFDTWKAESHEFTKNKNNGTRRYFFGEGHLVKMFTLDDPDFHDINFQEHVNETSFLARPPKDFQAPQIYLYGHHQREAWLVRQLLPGELLLDKIRLKKTYDVAPVVQDTLNQLAAWEAEGFYHNDLRIWNVLIDPNGHATLIDYGAASRERFDRGWPYNIFLSFMIYLHDVVNGNVTISNTVRTSAFNPDNFPAPYDHILWNMFNLTPDQWSFSFLRDSLSQSHEAGSTTSSISRLGIATILETIENAIQIHQEAAAYWRQTARLAASTDKDSSNA